MKPPVRHNRRSSKTRRAYRRTFRRVRFYLPLVLLLLVSMVIFLPVSGPWLLGRVESELQGILGKDVSVDRVEVTLATASVEALGATLKNVDGGEDFRLGRIALRGTPRGMLAGGGGWPDRIVVDGLPPLELSRGEGGKYGLRGPFLTLVETISALPERGSDVPADAAKPSRTMGRTPEVVVRNLPVEIESPIPGRPAIRAMIDEVLIAARPSRDSPVRLALSGVVISDTLDKLILTGLYFPKERRLTAEGSLSSAGIAFSIPSLGPFSARVRELAVQIDGDVSDENRITATLGVKAGRFELARDRVGGERWSDAPLELRVSGEFFRAEQRFELKEFSALGDHVDLSVDGSLRLDRALSGRVHAQIRKLPEEALALGRGELTGRLGVEVEATSTSPTLNLEVRASGEFTRPLEMQAEASLRAAGWRVHSAILPHPLDVKSVDVIVSTDQLRVRDLKLELGGARLSGSMDVPITNPAEPKWGTARVRVEGDSEAAFDLLSRLGVVPAEITGLNLPLNIDAEGGIGLTRTGTDLLSAPRVEIDRSSLAASVSWKAGSMEARALPDAIRVEPGSLRIDGREAAIQRLAINASGIDVGVSGTLRGDLLNPRADNLSYDGRLTTSGRFEALIPLLARLTQIPSLPEDLRGGYLAEFDVETRLDALAAATYRARLVLEGVGATVPTKYRPVPISDLSGEIVLDPEVLELRRIHARIVDPEGGNSTIDFSAGVTAERVRVDVGVQSNLEYLSLILPKDLKDLYMEGPLPASGWLSIAPAKPLPEGPDLLRRWIALIKSKPTIHHKLAADLMVDYEFAYMQSEPITIFPRDFPVRMTNMRGTAVVTPEGIRVRDARIDAGSAKDLVGDALVELGRPARITFDVRADHLDVNEWTDGWGQREWSSYPYSFPPRWKSIPEPIQKVIVQGTIHTKSIRYMNFDGGPTSGKLTFEAWSRIPNKLIIEDMKVEAFGGDADGRMDFLITPGERPTMTLRANLRDMEIKTFLDALRQKDQSLDGRLTGDLNFHGKLKNYPTYKGDARFAVQRSSVIGSVILFYAKEFLDLASGGEPRNSLMEGLVSMADEKIHFNALKITNPAANLQANGHIDFRGRLFFDVTANILGKQIGRIPGLGWISKPIGKLTDEALSYRVRGKLGSPEYYPVPSLLLSRDPEAEAEVRAP